jgi:hypothetical protein
VTGIIIVKSKSSAKKDFKPKSCSEMIRNKNYIQNKTPEIQIVHVSLLTSSGSSFYGCDSVVVSKNDWEREKGWEGTEEMLRIGQDSRIGSLQDGRPWHSAGDCRNTGFAFGQL